MKKLAVFSLIALAALGALGAQERKPVIGLTEITYKKGFQTISSGWDTLRDSNGDVIAPREEFPAIDTVATQTRAAFSAAIVNSKRFAVMERSAAELEKIRQENVETTGTLNPNTQLDFLLTGEIVEYQATRGAPTGLKSWNPLSSSVEKKFKLGVSVKFTDVQSGQIVISETFTKEVKGAAVTPNECSVAMANELIAKITTKLYPPSVFSVTGAGKVCQIPNAAYAQGDTIEVFTQGEPILDPYTGATIGYEEEFVAYIVVFEVNDTTNIAKAAPDPKGQYTSADIKKGMMIRKAAKKTDKAAIKNMKKAGIIK